MHTNICMGVHTEVVVHKLTFTNVNGIFTCNFVLFNNRHLIRYIVFALRHFLETCDISLSYRSAIFLGRYYRIAMRYFLPIPQQRRFLPAAQTQVNASWELLLLLLFLWGKSSKVPRDVVDVCIPQAKEERKEGAAPGSSATACVRSAVV